MDLLHLINLKRNTGFYCTKMSENQNFEEEIPKDVGLGNSEY